MRYIVNFSFGEMGGCCNLCIVTRLMLQLLFSTSVYSKYLAPESVHSCDITLIWLYLLTKPRFTIKQGTVELSSLQCSLNASHNGKMFGCCILLCSPCGMWFFTLKIETSKAYKKYVQLKHQFSFWFILNWDLLNWKHVFRLTSNFNYWFTKRIYVIYMFTMFTRYSIKRIKIILEEHGLVSITEKFN